MASHLTKAAGGASAEPKCLNPKQRGASQNGLQLSKKFSTCYTLSSVALWLIRLVLLMRGHFQINSLSVSVVTFYFSPHGSEMWREVCVISLYRVILRLTHINPAGYKWLKYVPTGILKTAQAAEWKIQAWMLGKPPTIAYRGIGYNAKSTMSTPPNNTSARRYPDKDTTPTPLPRTGRRPSLTSSVFSDYDDLRDFEGRFDSRSTLGARSSGSQRSRTLSESKPQPS